ncbi:hypothetical protein [Synechococcus phage S-B05]|nr:hypothetical protein [Synechococcus phage S-B05]
MVGLINLSRRSAIGFANSADVVATSAIDAVVVTVPSGGRYSSVQGISGLVSTVSSSSTMAVCGGVFGISGVSGIGGSGEFGTLGTFAGSV